MRTVFALGICSVMLLYGNTSALEGGDAAPEPRPEATETIVYSVNSASASKVCETLMQFFQDSEVRVVAEPTSNMLLIRVAADSRNEVIALLEKLDRPTRSILVEVQLLTTSDGVSETELDPMVFSGPSNEVAQRIRQLESEDRIHVSDRIQLTVVDNQKALFQVGKTVSIVTGTTLVGGARQVNSYQDRNIGTLVSLQAMTSDEGGISMSLQFEKSDVEPSVATDDDQPTPPSITTITHQSTVQLKDGNSVLAGTLVGRSNDSPTSAFLVVGARVMPQGDQVSFRSFSSSGTLSRASLGLRSSGASSRTSAGFGSRSSSTSRSGGFRRGGSGSSSRSQPSADRFRQYAVALIKRYDKNGDGKLNAEERKSMPKDYKDADTDDDGEVSADELAKTLRPS